MIKRKLKKCKVCGREQHIFSHGRCKSCTQKEEQYKINPISNKEKERRKLYKLLRKDYLLEHPVCEVNAEGCTIKATEIHHKAKRVGDNMFKYFCAICRNCHLKVEANPEWAYEMGYSMRIN